MTRPKNGALENDTDAVAMWANSWKLCNLLIICLSTCSKYSLRLLELYLRTGARVAEAEALSPTYRNG